jgi:hypothetical protein
VSEPTLIEWCKRTYDGKDFLTVFREKSETGKISLRRRQWQLAEKSPAMAIFLGKNILGQTDKMENTFASGQDTVGKLVFDFGGKKD